MSTICDVPAVLLLASVLLAACGGSAPEPAAPTWEAGDELMVQWDGPFKRVVVSGPSENGGWIVEDMALVAENTFEIRPEHVSGHPASTDPAGIAAFYLEAVHRCNEWSLEVGNGGIDLRWIGPTGLVYLVEAENEAGDRWEIADAAGYRLIVDRGEGIIEAAGEDGILPGMYSFCPEDLFVGYADA